MDPVPILIKEDMPPLQIKSLDYLNLASVKEYPAQMNVDEQYVLIKKFRNDLIQHGFDKFNTYETIYLCHRYFHEFEEPFLDLESFNMILLMSKKYKLELSLWSKNLYRELTAYLRTAEDKIKAVSLIINVTKHAFYYEYLPFCTLIPHLRNIMTILKNYHSVSPISSYNKIIIDLVKVFCWREDSIYWLFTYKDFDFLTLVESSQHEHFELFGLWGHNETLQSEQLTNICLFKNKKAAQILLMHGGVNYYSDECYQDMKLLMEIRIQIRYSEACSKEFVDYLESRDNRKEQFRIFQVYLLHPIDSSERNEEATAESVLQLLWRSISDPFLTYDDFMSLASHNEMMKIEMHYVWKWYQSNVNATDCRVKQPRTLQHLAGTVIRECLSKTFNYPKNVSKLGLTWLLEDFVYISRSPDGQN